MMQNSWLAAVGSLLACLTIATASLAGEVENGLTITFTVTDPETAKTYFTGVETIKVDGKVVTKETTYFGTNDQEIQRERIVYDEPTLKASRYSFLNAESGESVALEVKGERAHILYLEKTGAEAEEDKVDWTASTMIGKSLHHKIARGWQDLLAKKPIEFDLLVPFKMDSYGFQVVYAGDEGPLRVFRLEPTSWIARKIVAPMNFLYNDAKRLVRYRGPSTIEIEGDRNRIVDMQFSYGVPD